MKLTRLIPLIVGIFVVLLPVAVVVTIMLVPLWSWLEATCGIESIGHSGPAGWCYVAVYVVLVVVATAWVVWRANRRRTG
jgi:H+/Cl- antiporter ClcA